MTKYSILLALALVTAAPAYAQGTDELEKAFDICKEHRAASAYAPGWESCEKVRGQWVAKHTSPQRTKDEEDKMLIEKFIGTVK
jgi:hypothetical protein